MVVKQSQDEAPIIPKRKKKNKRRVWRNSDDEVVAPYNEWFPEERSRSSVFDDVSPPDTKRAYSKLMGKASKKLKKHNKKRVFENQVFEVARDPLTGNMKLQIEEADLKKFTAEELKQISNKFAKHQDMVLKGEAEISEQFSLENFYRKTNTDNDDSREDDKN